MSERWRSSPVSETDTYIPPLRSLSASASVQEHPPRRTSVVVSHLVGRSSRCARPVPRIPDVHCRRLKMYHGTAMRSAVTVLCTHACHRCHRLLSRWMRRYEVVNARSRRGPLVRTDTFITDPQHPPYPKHDTRPSTGHTEFDAAGRCRASLTGTSRAVLDQGPRGKAVRLASKSTAPAVT